MQCGQRLETNNAHDLSKINRLLSYPPLIVLNQLDELRILDESANGRLRD